MAPDLDDIDKQLLTLLQANARYTAIQLADAIGVSDNTIHNRMERLEAAGVITGYAARLDVEQVGLALYFHFSCTARVGDRAALAEEIVTIPEVIEVTELMTAHRNLQIKIVGADDDDINRVAAHLDELAVEIEDESLIRAEHAVPLDLTRMPDRIAMKS